MKDCDFHKIELESSGKLFELLQNSRYKDKWAFRGQLSNWSLETTIERACECANLVAEQDHVKIEDSIIRQFRRLYDGNDKEVVNNDTLYCMSLMRHYGGPVRLLDFTYSIYVAAYFALEYAYDNPPRYTDTPASHKHEDRACAVWCVNIDWVVKQGIVKVQDRPGENLVRQRHDLPTRNDSTFRPLYMENNYRLVGFENPGLLHKRLHLQQGVFLCPGDITHTFVDNLKALEGWEQETSIVKIICKMNAGDVCDALERCRRMNISRESLFPGLDGFAQSMKYHLSFYRNLFDYRQPPYLKSPVK